MPDPNQNTIGAAPPQTPVPSAADLAILNNPIDSGAANPADRAILDNPVDRGAFSSADLAILSNPIDAARSAQPQAPSLAAALPRDMTISPSQPGVVSRVKAIFGSRAPSSSVMANITGQVGARGGQTPQWISPAAAMTPSEQQRHPVLTGLGEAAGGILTPENVMLYAGTSGLAGLPGVAGKILPRLVSGAFSASMIKSAYDNIPEIRAAANRGDTSEVKRLLTHMVANIGLGYATGRYAVKGAAPAKPGAPAPAEAAPPTGVPEELAQKIPALRQGEPAPAGTPQVAAAPAGQVTDAAAATTRAQAAGMSPEMTARIQQNAQALKPIVDPAKITSRADIQAQLDQAANVLRNNPDPRMQQPLTNAESDRLAQNLAMTREEFLSSPSGKAFNAEQIIGANAIVEAMRTETMNLARLAATGDTAYQQSFLESLAKFKEVQQKFREGPAREAGRTLQRLQAPPTEGTLAAAVDALSKLPQDAQLTAAQQLNKIDPNNAGAVAKFVREITPSSTADKLHEAWLNSLLSGGIGPVKAVSDVTMRALGIATRPVAAAIDVARAAATGTPRERFAGDIGADVFGMFKGASRAASQFADTFLHENSLTEDVMGRGGRGGAIKGPLGKIVRTPTRLLEAITDSAKLINFSSEVHTQAYRQAMSEGLSGKEAWSRATEIAANPTPEMRQAAGDYALRQTFQQRLGWIGRTAQAGKNINVMRAFGPTVGEKVSAQPGRWLIPFFRTPLNIVKAAAEYSPVGAIGTAVRAKWGGLEGGALSDAIAKNTVGTALAAAITYGALEGHVTGAGPVSAKERMQLEAAGWQPYSIRIGGKYFSYKRAEPLGTVFSTAADLAETIRANPASLGSEGLANQLKNRIDRNIEHAEFIGGLMKVNQMWESPGKYVRGLAGSVIPTGVANIAHILDPTIRTPDREAPFLQQVQQQLESRIPGLSERVPPVTTPRGQPLQRPANALGGFSAFPVTTAQPGLDTLQQQLAREDFLRQRKAALARAVKERKRSAGRP